MKRVVIKLGGSLFDLPDLRKILLQWLEKQSGDALIIVPGGGGLSDVIRALDRIHQFGEETAHWLALRSLSLSAQVLLSFLPEAHLMEYPNPKKSGLFILDPFAFAQQDETQIGHLPHTWEVTTDSISLRVANVAQADKLILLKSVDDPTVLDPETWARAGLVDRMFPQLVKCSSVPIEWINFRRISATGSRTETF